MFLLLTNNWLYEKIGPVLVARRLCPSRWCKRYKWRSSGPCLIHFFISPGQVVMRIHRQSLMKNGKGNWIPVLECYYARVPYDFVRIIEIHRQYYISVNLLFFLDKNEVGRQKSIHHILCGWLALFPIQEDKWPLFSKSNFPPFFWYTYIF
jgi:hypothetical protein